MKRIAALLLGVTVALSAAEADNSADALYSAIRANDLARLVTQLKGGANVSAVDAGGTTALMQATVTGSVEAMKLLLDNGADAQLKSNANATALMWSVTDIRKVRLLLDHGVDVNAVSKLGRTALLLAAMSDGSVDVVRLLMARGADPRVVDSLKKTALLAATEGGDTETIRLLVDAGLDVNAVDFAGFTPLMNAASKANVAAVRLLLAKGANVNAVSGDGSYQKVKAGTIALGNWTPLLAASAFGPAELVRTLLDAGANVNAQDVRGLTPLMFAVSTDRQDAEVIRALIEKGADVNLKSLSGETALDLARKIGAAPAIVALRRAGARETPAAPVSLPPFAPADLKTSVNRSVALLETASAGFAAKGGCASCHSHNIVDLMAQAARARGVQLDAKSARDRQQLTKARFFSASNQLERMDSAGTPDVPLYALAAFASTEYAPDRTTDAMIANTIANQLSDGRWGLGSIARPPIQDGDIFRTALGIRALKVYGPPGRTAEIAPRIARATAWLAAAKPTTAEDRNMQLVGLHWARADARALKGLAKAILVTQRADGGWSQTANLKSDAYATGQSLFALVEAGILSPRDQAYRKGVNYLLATQHADGSWYVRSRALKFQPYFESGFPYAHDQWISSMATGWAATALTLALDSAAN
jgi:ankyrin repeat protein